MHLQRCSTLAACRNSPLYPLIICPISHAPQPRHPFRAFPPPPTPLWTTLPGCASHRLRPCTDYPDPPLTYSQTPSTRQPSSLALCFHRRSALAACRNSPWYPPIICPISHAPQPRPPFRAFPPPPTPLWTTLPGCASHRPRPYTDYPDPPRTYPQIPSTRQPSTSTARHHRCSVLTACRNSSWYQPIICPTSPVPFYVHSPNLHICLRQIQSCRTPQVHKLAPPAPTPTTER